MKFKKSKGLSKCLQVRLAKGVWEIVLDNAINRSTVKVLATLSLQKALNFLIHVP